MHKYSNRHTRPKNLLRVAGFTLIELMITVAVVGILAAIAYPSYQQQVKQSRRADAQAALVSLAGVMEKNFSQNNSYEISGAAPTLGTASGTIFANQVPINGGTKTYDLTLVADKTTYTLKATPSGAQAGDGYLTLDNKNAREWNQDNNGAIADPAEKDWDIKTVP